MVRWSPPVRDPGCLCQVRGKVADDRRGDGAAEQRPAVVFGRFELDSEPVSSAVPVRGWPNRNGRTS
jgi:hypothetical protein